jgi:hypothetical protein
MSGQVANGDDAVGIAIDRACALFPPPPTAGANPYAEPRIEYLLKLSQLVEGRIVFEASWIVLLLLELESRAGWVSLT